MEHTLLHRRLAADLTTAMIYSLLRLRVEVFVVEQGCPYQDLDGQDLETTTRHFWLAPDGAMQDARATLRMVEPTDGRFQIGRICVAPRARGRGAMRRLLEAALGEVGAAPCTMDAQAHLAGFYSAFGFVPAGAEFIQDGIAHVPMLRERPVRVG